MSGSRPIPEAVWMRLIAGQGRIESGMVANMRLYLLPLNPKTHARIVTEKETLCGVPIMNPDPQGRMQVAWQFIHRGSIAAGRLPRHVDCKRCLATETWRACEAAVSRQKEAT